MIESSVQQQKIEKKFEKENARRAYIEIKETH
jgi:hypothetical protein